MDSADSRRVRFSEVKFESSLVRAEENIEEFREQRAISEEKLFFNTSKEACTPTINRVLYRNPENRGSQSVAPPSSISRPNYEDILRRVSVVIHQHISKCELKLSRMSPEAAATATELFRQSKIEAFAEENYTSPQYVYHFVRAPFSRLGFLYGIRKMHKQWNSPSMSEVHIFLRDLFVKAQLSAECSIGERKENNDRSEVEKLSFLHILLMRGRFLPLSDR